jgi:hypothetical protein
MIYLLKTGLLVFLAAWCVLGLWLIVHYGKLFGPHPDDPAESPGARSFGVTHIWIVWFGVFALAGYFLFR